MLFQHMHTLRFALRLALLGALALPAIAQQGTIRIPYRSNFGEDATLVVFTADGRAWTPSFEGILVVDARGGTTTLDDTLPNDDRYVRDLVLGSDGAVWGRSTRRVLRIDPATHAVQLIPFANDVEAIGAGPDGAIWVITRSGEARQLVRLSTAGAALSTVDAPALSPVLATYTDPDTVYPFLAAGGSMWIGGDELARVSADGTIQIVALPIPNAFWLFPANDFLWVAALAPEPQRIVRVSFSGEVLATFTPIGPDPMTGGAAGADGSLLIHHHESDPILRLTPAGVVSTIGTVAASLACRTYGIVPVTIAPDGRIAIVYIPVPSVVGPPGQPCDSGISELILLDSSHLAQIPVLGMTGFLALAAILSVAGAVRVFGR